MSARAWQRRKKQNNREMNLRIRIAARSLVFQEKMDRDRRRVHHRFMSYITNKNVKEVV